MPSQVGWVDATIGTLTAFPSKGVPGTDTYEKGDAFDHTAAEDDALGIDEVDHRRKAEPEVLASLGRPGAHVGLDRL